MQTIKTAVVTVLLMIVLYGAYVAINTPPPMMPDSIAHIVEQQGPTEDPGSLDVPDIGEINVPGFDSFSGEITDSTDGVTASLSSGANLASESISSGGQGVTASLSSDDPNPGTAPGVTASISSGEIDLPDLPAINMGVEDQSNSPSPITTAALPKPDPGSPAVSADPNQAYPSTPNAGLSLTSPHGVTAEISTPPLPEPAQPAAPAADGFGMPPGVSQPGNTIDQASAELIQKPQGIDNAITSADRQYAAGQLREALFNLSLFYGSPDLTVEQKSGLMSRLNALAGEVIYSPRHLVESAYRVQSGETLQSIANDRRIPWQLLANINGIQNPTNLTPGTELKVVTGPFRAEVDLDREVVVLFLGDLYAGQFKCITGTSPAPVEGTFTVQDKQQSRAYYGMDGTTFAAGDPRNPYGKVWLDLGNRLCIHGSPEMQPGVSGLGCIQLKPADARDLFGILSQGSSVTIRR